MHLVIVSRSDPPLPLARLRGRGELTELRASDLRFTPDEAAAFLNEMMGLDLSAASVAALETRTEGWITGLQLAAVSMQGREDVSGFIAAFSGDDRFIVDYLVEEVLQRQPERVRSFLLQTSVLERFSGPLCDAVTGQEDSKEMLEALERGNLFVVSLDDKRQWYRYHHLFADVLRAHSMEEQSDRLPTLHRRAAAWFEENGMAAEAIEQARAAGDHEAVARLLSANFEEFERIGQYTSLSNWSASLPEEMVRKRPRLAIIHAKGALVSGVLQDCRLSRGESNQEVAHVSSLSRNRLVGHARVGLASPERRGAGAETPTLGPEPPTGRGNGDSRTGARPAPAGAQRQGSASNDWSAAPDGTRRHEVSTTEPGQKRS